ncbi:MAG: Mur ligase domain-containing protein, partial [Oligoflexia bacterium]|nr:Mur ligase domain-containing protein [Oligoflexia bacterium]
MKFANFLLSAYSLVKGSLEEIQISSIISHSDKVKSNSLFVAIKGCETDGHKYLEQAVKRGAGVLLIENHKA